MVRLLFYTGLLLFLWIITSSCKDRKIDALEADQVSYSVYGAFDLHDSVNVVRVRDVRTFLAGKSAGDLDAKVTFFDPKEGDSVMLKDSIVEFPAGLTNNFILNRHLKPRERYQIIVDRSDGESVSTTFTMPGVTKTEIRPTVQGVSCSKRMDIVFKNVLPDEQIRWYAGFRQNGEWHWLEFSRRCDGTYNESTKELTFREEPWGLLTQFLHAHRIGAACEGREIFFDCSDLDDGRMYLRYTHLGPEWQHVYPLSNEDPLEMGNIENGIGFIGGFREDTLSFKVYQE